MAIIRLKKGYDLNLKGRIVDPAIGEASTSELYAIVPDDFTGLTPRMDKREGERVRAGEPL
ncbi:MAG: NADH:ubiquinone reductase (Na(+)-transporting) subunit A, partial [Muribaculaceae bacterium]|nr:NADH:ubiquinone reductase (Na(+)-transporting) subunit A [Muribaculaceae bacterium]